MYLLYYIPQIEKSQTERKNVMFIENDTLVKATYFDKTTYTGKVYKIVVQMCEDDNNRPHALLFISQDKKYIEQDGEFGCVSLWVDKLKSIEVI